MFRNCKGKECLLPLQTCWEALQARKVIQVFPQRAAQNLPYGTQKQGRLTWNKLGWKTY